MHLHILGICGTFMAGLAALARAAGHRVTGSDQNVYPPMSEQLAALGIDIIEGYAADQLDLRPDVVIVGNVMTRGMPVVEALLDSGIEYSSGPAWLREHVLRGREVIAVAGTHGKTTTASIIAWLLERAGREPGFLIGGIPRDFGVSARLGAGSAFVIEADEYDTAFFDKRAKFLHYQPAIMIITNLEFDHADIYADLPAIQWQFHQALRAMPGRGLLVLPAADPHIRELVDMGCWTPHQTFGSDPGADPDWTATVTGDGELVVADRQHERGRTRWPMPGAHNAENAVAALLAVRQLGVGFDTALDALGSFSGVKRRLELRGVFRGVELYDDFAHHPTEIRRTIEGLVAAFESGRLLVVLEPRSNTMKLGIHRHELAGALQQADEVWVYQPADLDWDLRAALACLQSVHIHQSIDGIVGEVARKAGAGDRVIIMSNGGFGGIHASLAAALDAASPGH